MSALLKSNPEDEHKDPMENEHFIRTPKIYVIGRPALDERAISEFLSDESTSWRRTKASRPGEELVEFGGRVCYMSFGKAQSPRDLRAYIGNLVDKGHDSVLEHATWTFAITGVSRAFSHQLVRHRAGFSFSQLSQQYHEEVNARFVIPEVLLRQPDLLDNWKEYVQAAQKGYNELLQRVRMQQPPNPSVGEQRRALRSAARSVMPNATETKIVVTANARAIRYFLIVRGSTVGDIEMRRVCGLLLEAMRLEAPLIFEDFELENLPDGTPRVSIRAPRKEVHT